MERDAAKLVALEAFRAMHLSDMLPFLKQVCAPEEYEELRRGIAATVAAIGSNILDPIFRMHPDLEVELDGRVKRTGKAY